MITRALGLVVIGCLTACGAPLEEAELAGLEAEAAALTPSPPRPIVWERFGSTSNTSSIAVCENSYWHGYIFRLNTDGGLQFADAYDTKPPVWRTNWPLAAYPGASALTCGRIRGDVPELLLTMRTGELWKYDFVDLDFTPRLTRLQTRVPKAIEVKAFSFSDLWMLDQFGGYSGAVSSSGTIAWTTRNPPPTTKRTAVTTTSALSRIVVAVKEDNTFWLSRDGGATFEALASSFDSAMVGASVVDLEAVYRSPLFRDDPLRIYIFALLNGPAGQQIYRGVIENVW